MLIASDGKRVLRSSGHVMSVVFEPGEADRLREILDKGRNCFNAWPADLGHEPKRRLARNHRLLEKAATAPVPVQPKRKQKGRSK